MIIKHHSAQPGINGAEEAPMNPRSAWRMHNYFQVAGCECALGHVQE